MPDSSKKLKTIVVGAKSPYCDDVRWSQINLRNFVDFDVAILIFRDLKTGVGALDSPTLTQMQQQLLRVLESGGQLIVITPGQCNLKIKHSPQNVGQIDVSIANILPIAVSFRNESGSTVVRVIDKPYACWLLRYARERHNHITRRSSTHYR